MKLHELHLKHVPFDDVKYPDYIYNDLGFAILQALLNNNSGRILNISYQSNSSFCPHF